MSGTVEIIKDGFLILMDEEDYHLYRTFKFHLGGTGKHRYLKSSQLTPTLFHRYIIKVPDGLVVDHINRNTLDNRKENLRLCTQSINMFNKAVIGYRGVAWSKQKQKWRARMIGRAGTHIGMFDSEIDAAVAVDRFTKLLYPEYPELLNFPEVANGG